MRNVTIVVEEELARWARIRAAELDTSVSRLIADMLRDRMLEEGGYEAARRQHLSEQPVVLKRSGRYPTREELHERDGLR